MVQSGAISSHYLFMRIITVLRGAAWVCFCCTHSLTSVPGRSKQETLMKIYDSFTEANHRWAWLTKVTGAFWYSVQNRLSLPFQHLTGEWVIAEITNGRLWSAGVMATQFSVEHQITQCWSNILYSVYDKNIL